MPNIDLKYARSNTTGTSEQRGSEQPRGEEGERAGELLRDRSEWQPVGPSVRLAVAGCAGPSDGRIRHEIVGKDILREKPLLSSSLLSISLLMQDPRKRLREHVSSLMSEITQPGTRPRLVLEEQNK